jgi:hypothetical protein
MDPQARVITDSATIEEVAAKFRSDGDFRALLIEDSGKALDSLGIQVPKDVVVRVEGDTPATERLVVYGPEGSELTDEDLEQVAGGLAMPTFQLRRPILGAVALYDVSPARNMNVLYGI